MHRIPGREMTRERLHFQPPKCGWSDVAICPCILIIGFVLVDNQAWGQQVPSTRPSSPLLRQASATRDVPEDDALGDDLLGDADDILSLADESLESLSQRQVVAPALEEVVSSVSRQESTVGRSPAAVYVVTAERIRRSGAQTIAEALRMVPGLNVAKRDSNKWAISARGFNERYAKKLLVQIDGRTVYTPVFAGTYWDVQDVVLADIERIEVIRGPGATVWGANAVNGVINIITKSAKETCGVYAKAGGGSEESGFSTVRVGGCRGDVAWRAYGKWFERDGAVAIGGPAQDDWRQKRGGFRTDWTPSTCDTLTLQGDAYAGTSGATFFGYTRDDNEVQGHNLLGRWTRVIDDDTDYSLQLYYDSNDRDGTALSQHVETFDVDFQYRFPLGPNNNVIWGLGYRRVDDMLETMPPPFVLFTPPSAVKHLYSGFIQDEVTLREDSLYLTLGTKLEKNDFSGFEIQPSIRLLWLPSERTAAWGAISRAVRTPARHCRDAWTTSFVQTFGPSPGFGSEELIAYELGYRAQSAERFSWDLALFYNVYEDLQSWQQTGFGFPPHFVQSNNMAGHAYGAECSGKYQATESWNLTAWYSLVQIQAQQAPTLAPTVARLEGSSPHNQVFLMSSWDLSYDLEFDLITRYVDELPAQSVPSYISLDLRLGWHPTDHTEMAIVGQNLLDSRHLEFGNQGGEPTPLVEVQRGLYGMVTWRH